MVAALTAAEAAADDVMQPLYRYHCCFRHHCQYWHRYLHHCVVVSIHCLDAKDELA